MIFIPIFFICTINSDCDFMPFEATDSREKCEISVMKNTEILSENPLVRRFMAVCVQVDEAVLIQKGSNV